MEGQSVMYNYRRVQAQAAEVSLCTNNNLNTPT